MITVHGHPSSPYSNSVRLFLEELNLSYHFEWIALEKSENLKSAYATLNPLRRVPLLQWGGFFLAESRAIIRYVAAREEAYAWYPLNLEARAIVDQWIDYASIHIALPLTALTWERHWSTKLGIKANPYAQNLAISRLERELPILEEHLGSRRYLCGTDITLADICLFPAAVNHAKAQLSLQNYPAFLDWITRMENRDAWQRCLSKTLPSLRSIARGRATYGRA